MSITRTELLRELARGIDPVAFARSLGFPDLDNWQRDLLLSTEKQTILNCARQSGKSLICAILGLYEALNTPGSLVLILSPSLRQSGELFKKIQTLSRTRDTRSGNGDGLDPNVEQWIPYRQPPGNGENREGIHWSLPLARRRSSES